jgi:Right handed beta helix region
MRPTFRRRNLARTRPALRRRAVCAYWPAAMALALFAGVAIASSSPALGALPRVETVSTSATSSSATSLTISTPSGVASGDVMLAAIDVNLPGSAAITAPSGWTLVRRDNNAQGYAALSQAVYYRVAGNSEPSSARWQFSASAGASGAMISFSAVDTTSPVDAHSGRYTPRTKSITAPGVSTSARGDVLVGFFGTSGTRSIYAPSGMSEAYDLTGTGSTGAASSEGADQIIVSPGSTGSRTATTQGSRNSSTVGQLIALRPAATAAAPAPAPAPAPPAPPPPPPPPPPPAAPVNTALPTISGTAQAGSTLTASQGVWSSALPVTLAYRWSRCDAAAANCTTISGAAAANYALTTADVGSRLVATVTASNSGGSTAAASAPSGVVQPATTPSLPAPACDRTLTSGSISSFVNSLSPGQVGCLQGSFSQSIDITAAGVTLESVPGTTASICGELDVEDSADNVTVQNLTLDGSCAGGSIGIYMRGENTLLQGNEITNKHQGPSCILVGQSPAGWDANNVTIRRNVIHDCGIDATRDQGIYVLRTTGTVIEDNTIYNTSAFAMQYWGQVTNTTYRYNVSDGGPNTSRGNLIVGADSGTPPYNNTVHDNIIAYTKHVAFEGGFGGTNNVVSNNCVWQTSGMFSGSNGWTDGGGNVSVDPQFVDRANHNYALKSGSPCAGKGPR